MLEAVTIEKLVHGGQGLGVLADGRKVFVWNALPGERVNVRIIKKRNSYSEAIAEEILEASPERISPKEANYLATSPWQIITFDAENKYKGEIVSELYAQAHVVIPKFVVTHTDAQWNYRNKMEYSFWGDKDGVHLALHNRGSHQKTIVTGSALALPSVDVVAQTIVNILNTKQVRAGDVKTIIVRSSQKGVVVASLFVKTKTFQKIELPPELHGLRVYYSNPKSPASVMTKLLYEKGDTILEDTLLDTEFSYDADSFFQVNLPIFEQALLRIKDNCNADKLVDMYAGVGSIGLSVGHKEVTLVELDPATAAMAHINADASVLQAEVVEASTERSLAYITPDKPVIFDPPRAGLHDKVVDRVLEVLPPQVIYLSCNPATQARDLAKLQERYDISYFEVFNFFPRTPHIETLAILKLR
jgi:23S rRNA (uracil1939-C5)-methyltransferase